MKREPIEWYDEYLDTKKRKIVTDKEYHIPGLRMIGCHNTSRALAPLSPHFHKDCFEFTYVVQGNLSFTVNGRTYQLSSGDLFVTFPNEIHDTGNEPMPLHKIYWFQIDVSKSENFLFTETSMAKELIRQLYSLKKRIIKMDEITEKWMEEIFKNVELGETLGKLMSSYMLGSFLCQVIKKAEAPDQKVKISSDIRKAKAYIQEHIEESITMEKLAEISMLSISRFKQKFQQQLGNSPRAYINYYKIEAAKRMLQEGKNVTDTAMKLGFSSSNYFSSVFHRYTSQSPSTYRREMKKD